MHGLFITGTDTGVGKTRIGTTLAHCLVERGVRVRVRKPVESGCVRGENGLLPQDALALHAAARSAEPLERVCRYCLEAAISPERAAALEGLALNLEQLLAACRAGVNESDASAWADLAPCLDALAKRLVVGYRNRKTHRSAEIERDEC